MARAHKQGDILGGEFSLRPEYLDSPEASWDWRERQGVFANYPASTPKYNTSNASMETMARIFVPLPDEKTRGRYLKTFRYNPIALKYAERLAAVKGASDEGTGYIDFLLMQARESFQEKLQIVSVLSDNYVSYFFGQEPPVFNYAGVVFNTVQDNWRAAFTILYQEILRGTQLARRKVTMTLTYDDVAVTGELINMVQTLTGSRETAADFTFQMLVRRYDIWTAKLRSPTIVGALPAWIQPDLFAVRPSGASPRTIRVIDTPEYQEPKRENPAEEKPEGLIGELDMSSENNQVREDKYNPTPSEIGIELVGGLL